MDRRAFSMIEHASIEEIRSFYAQLMAAVSKSPDPRLERAFETVPREAFLPPGPWKVMIGRQYFETPSADPVYLYQNVLIALDAAKRINNGEPYLHAAWIGTVAPQRGETISHIGAGTGYYTAVLSMLVLPTGAVSAFEIDKDLAERARHNLEPFEGVNVVNGDATRQPLPKSDVIYVNAGVAAPPVDWLRALKPGGRLIFPWRPSEDVALTLLVRAEREGFSVTPLMPSWFIPCIGASSEIAAVKVPANFAEAQSIRSIWPTADRAPDQGAIAIYPQIWFSADAAGAIH
jgi:protein-L-isoaspartate(D-aspartate) O-methyltransferase